MANTLLGVGAPKLVDIQWILASGSPRRFEIFRQMGLDPRIEKSGFAEDLSKADFPTAAAYAEATAIEKAREVAARVLPAASKATLVVGSDTVVEIDGDVLEKPSGEEDAVRMLQRLSGRNHLVHSGVAVFCNLAGQEIDKAVLRFAETTEVTFTELGEDDIRHYVASGEPMDKAGSYGVQGLGGQMVERLHGCYFNVMGFPMHRFSREITSVLRGLGK